MYSIRAMGGLGDFSTPPTLQEWQFQIIRAHSESVKGMIMETALPRVNCIKGHVRLASYWCLTS